MQDRSRMMKRMLFFILPLIAVGGLYLVMQYIEPSLIQTYLAGFGDWMLLLYIFMYLIAVWIPHAGTIMTIVGGLLFHPVFAVILVMFLSTFGSILPFLAGRKWFHRRLRRWIVKKGYEKYARRVNKDSFLFVLYLRLLPLIPYEVQNYLIGLTNITLRRFIVATFVGLLPGTLGLVMIGETIADTSVTNIIILIATTIIAITVPWIVKRYGHAQEVLEGYP